jgi:ketosteroid isomerase-like protein
MISSGPVDDRLAIRELVDSYNDAVMRFDGESWKANWAEDATWHLPGAGAVSGRDNIHAAWEGAMSAFSFVGFFASAGPIVVDGDRATGTWYQQEFLHQKDGVRRSITGKYSDEYVRKSGRWYFQTRNYEILHAE